MPAADQFMVEPATVPFAVPVTGMPAQVAVLTIVAVVGVAAATDQLIAVHAPLPDGERQTPVKGAIGSGVGVGLDGVFSLHAQSDKSTTAIGGASDVSRARVTCP